jgi:hypothetical protein
VLVIRFEGKVVTFEPADIIQEVPGGIRWFRRRTPTQRGDGAVLSSTPQSFIFHAMQDIDEDVQGPGAASDNLQTTKYFLIGDRMAPAEIPTPGILSYSVTLETSVVGRNRGGGFAAPGTLTIDFSQKTVTARLNATQSSYVTGTTPDCATLLFNGKISSTGISGNITSPDTEYTGAFTGDIFGPRAIETGLVFTLSRPDGVRAAGKLVARQR